MSRLAKLPRRSRGRVSRGMPTAIAVGWKIRSRQLSQSLPVHRSPAGGGKDEILVGRWIPQPPAAEIPGERFEQPRLPLDDGAALRCAERDRAAADLIDPFRYGGQQGRHLRTATTIAGAVVLLATLLAAWLGQPVAEEARYALIVPLAVAMGIQNATARHLAVPTSRPPS